MDVKSLLIKIGTDTRAMEAGFKKADGLIAKNAEKFKKAGRIMTGAGVAIIGSLGLMIKNYADAGDAIDKMSKRTEFSCETLSELKYASELCGAGLGDIEKATKKMSGTIADADDGLATYVRAFDKLGLSVDDLTAMNPEEQFLSITEAIASIEQPFLRVALAEDIFGKAGTKLLPMMAEGVEGLRAMREEAHRLAPIFDTEAAAAAAKLKDAQLKLKGAMSGVTIAIAENLVPAISGLTEKFAEVVAKVRGWIEENPALTGTLAKIVGAVGALSLVLGPLLMVLPGLATLVSALHLKLLLWKAGAVLVTAANAILGTSFSVALGPITVIIAAIAALVAIAVLVVKNWDHISGFFIGLWQTIAGAFTTAIEFISGIVSGAFNAITGFLTSFIEGYIGLYVGFFETITGIVSTAWEAIVGFFTGAFTAISEFVTTFIEDFTLFFSDFFIAVEETASLAWETITGFFTGAFTTIKVALTGFIGDFIAFFTGFSTDLYELVTGLVTRIIEKFTGMFRKVKEIVGKLKDATIGIFKKLKDKISGNSIVPDMCSDIVSVLQKMKEDGVAEFDDLAEKGKAAIEDLDAASSAGFGNIEDYVGAMASEVGSAFTSVAGSLKESGRAILKTLQGKAIAYIVTKVMAAVPFPFNLVAVAGAIAGVKALFSTIKLGEGAIVMRPTMATIGERGPEAVIPLNKLGGGLQPAPVYVKQTNYFYGDINNSGDIDEISDRLAQRMTRQIERGRRS